MQAIILAGAAAFIIVWPRQHRTSKSHQMHRLRWYHLN
jgi:hypothetical protein